MSFYCTAYIAAFRTSQLQLLALCCLLQFDGVLENVSQDVVYNTCVHEAVDSSLAGYNSTVFAYGQVCAQPGNQLMDVAIW